MVVSEAGPRPLSRVLVELSRSAGERIALGAVVAALADRSFAALMLFLAAPNLVPLPPGSSTVFGIPLILVAAQLVAGRPQAWLPAALRERSLDRGAFASVATRLEPWLRRLEALARPRWWPWPRAVADRYVGLLSLVMAIVLALPIPFGNGPPALAIVLASLALSERDGLWLAAGTLVAGAALAIAGGVVGAAGIAAAGILS